jgi:hypothetical protein
MRDAPWSPAEARAWYEGLPWLLGCNFVPGFAVNAIELWREPSFDVESIKRELGFAAEIGFNTLRVFLHDLAYEEDPSGFISRLDTFLALAGTCGLRVMFVFFDDCWHPEPRLGPQPDPLPGVHNSRWVQSPGDRVARDPAAWPRLERYVQDVIGAFGQDPRVLMWDLYNEPGNTFLPSLSRGWVQMALELPPLLLQHLLQPSQSLPLLQAVFSWARGVGPAQPLTAGLWAHNAGLNHFQEANSDVLTFHHYGRPASLAARITGLSRHERPLICTEFLARRFGSRFETHLPVLHEARVGALCWGLVTGRTQTRFSWLDRPGSAEPALWFHDILRPEGTFFDEEEAVVLRRWAAHTRRFIP